MVLGKVPRRRVHLPQEIEWDSTKDEENCERVDNKPEPQVRSGKQLSIQSTKKSKYKIPIIIGSIVVVFLFINSIILVAVIVDLSNNDQQEVNLDKDSDGLLDEWERIHFGNMDQLPEDDFDNDGYTNFQEYINGTDPTVVNVIHSGDDDIGPDDDDISPDDDIIGDDDDDDINPIDNGTAINTEKFARIIPKDEFLDYLEEEGIISSTSILDQEFVDLGNPNIALLIEEDFPTAFNDENEILNYISLGLIEDLDWDEGRQNELQYVEIKGTVFSCSDYFKTEFTNWDFNVIIIDLIARKDHGKFDTLDNYYSNSDSYFTEAVTSIDTDGYLAGTTTNRIMKWIGEISGSTSVETVADKAPVDIGLYFLSDYTYTTTGGEKITSYNVPVIYFYLFEDSKFYSEHPVNVKGFYVDNKKTSGYTKSKSDEWTLKDDTNSNICDTIGDTEDEFSPYLAELLGNYEDVTSQYNFDGWIFAYSITQKSPEVSMDLQSLHFFYEIEKDYENQLITRTNTKGFPIGTTIKTISKQADKDQYFPFDIGLYLFNDVSIDTGYPENTKSYHLPIILISEDEEKTRVPLNYSTVDGLYIRGEMIRNATMKFIKNLIRDESTVNLDLIYQAILDNLTMLEGNGKVNTFDGVILAYDIIDITPTITENELIDSLNHIGFIQKINDLPAVAIINPIASEIISGTYSINGTATDPDGDSTIEKVQIKIDNGTWIDVSGTNSWSFIWNTTSVSDGPHTIYARAFDGKNYSIIPEPSVAITVTNN